MIHYVIFAGIFVLIYLYAKFIHIPFFRKKTKTKVEGGTPRRFTKKKNVKK